MLFRDGIGAQITNIFSLLQDKSIKASLTTPNAGEIDI
jgi:hypothetical protein